MEETFFAFVRRRGLLYLAPLSTTSGIKFAWRQLVNLESSRVSVGGFQGIADAVAMSVFYGVSGKPPQISD